MSLEEIEQDALHYLAESENPLVQVEALYRHVTSRNESHAISLEDFMDFLEQHELVKVTDPMAYAEPDSMLAALEHAGLPTNPCAILEERVPNRRDLAVSMLEQLETLTKSLSAALQEARGTGDSARAHTIYETLERVKKLKARIGDHITSI